MRKNLILPLILVIGILLLFPVASASIWEKLGLTRATGAPVAYSNKNPAYLHIIFSNPKEADNFYTGQNIPLEINIQKDPGYPYTKLEYKIFSDGGLKKGPSQISSATGDNILLKAELSQLNEGEHKITFEICGLEAKKCGFLNINCKLGEAGGCVGVTSQSVNIFVKTREAESGSAEAVAVQDASGWSDYTLYEGGYKVIEGTKITVRSITDKEVTIVTERTDTLNLGGESKVIPKNPLKIRITNVDVPTKGASGLKRSVTLKVKKA